MRKRTHLGFGTSSSPVNNMDAAIEAFYRRCQAKNLSPHTISFYRYRLNAFMRYLGTEYGKVAPGKITSTQIRDFIAQETTRVSAATGDDSFVTLRALFKYLSSEGIVESTPMTNIERPKQKKTVITSFTPAQIEAMLGACGNSFNGVRDRAIILTLLDCGLRVGELCGLRIQDINWTEETMLVTGKGNKERVVPFGRTTRASLLSYWERRGDIPQTDLLFLTCYGDPITRLGVYSTIVRIGKKAEVSGVRISPHTFRHTCAVMYLRSGGDVFSLQKLLGHTDLTMTRRYAELSQSDVIQKHRLFSPADTIKPPSQSGRKRLR